MWVYAPPSTLSLYLSLCVIVCVCVCMCVCVCVCTRIRRVFMCACADLLCAVHEVIDLTARVDLKLNVVTIGVHE